MCGWVRGTGTGRLKAGSGLVERFWGPSPGMDWLDIFIEVAPGPIQDQRHLPCPGADGDRRGHPSGVAFLLLSLGPHLMRPHPAPLCMALFSPHRRAVLPLRGLSVRGPWSFSPDFVKALLQPCTPGGGSHQSPRVRCLALDQLALGEWGQRGARGRAHLALRVCGGVGEYQGRGRSITAPPRFPHPLPTPGLLGQAAPCWPGRR